MSSVASVTSSRRRTSRVPGIEDGEGDTERNRSRSDDEEARFRSCEPGVINAVRRMARDALSPPASQRVGHRRLSIHDRCVRQTPANSLSNSPRSDKDSAKATGSPKGLATHYVGDERIQSPTTSRGEESAVEDVEKPMGRHTRQGVGGGIVEQNVNVLRQ